MPGPIVSRPLLKKLVVAVLATLTISGTLIFQSGSRVQGDIIPSVNNTYDLGSSTNSWAEAHIGQTSTSRVLVGAGSVSAPSMTFKSASTTGLYLFSSNTPAIAAGGAVSAYFQSGKIFAKGSYATLADGDGYYFGDEVRGLRYLSGDDFEFQQWHVGGQFYQSSFNGITRSRYVVHDAPTKRSAFSASTDLRNYTPKADLEVIGVASSTSMIVSNTSTVALLSVGNAAPASILENNRGLMSIAHNPSQSEADIDRPFMSIQNTSSTLSSTLAWWNHDATNYLFSIKAFNVDAPLNEGFGFKPGNMTFLESTSGTVLTAGDGVAVLSASGAFRPVTGLGFGNNDYVDPYLSSASTTITNGNMVTVALDFGNSAAAGTQDLTATVSGATAGDECQLAGSAFAADLFSRADETYTCVATAADTMTVRRTCVNAAGCGDPSSVNVNIGFFTRQ